MRRLWGLVSDIHFDLSNLQRVVQSARWITETFADRRATHILVGGDILNTRHAVNVEVLSAAFGWLRDLTDVAPVSIIAGNHDLYFRSSSLVSSLDAVRLFASPHKLRLFKTCTLSTVDGHPFLFLPFHDNPAVIAQFIAEHITPEEKCRIVALGHLSIPGATLRQHNGSPILYQPSPTASAEAARRLPVDGFKHLFSGHFHHHHMCRPRVTYIGAPLQFGFGDAHERRGVVLYNPDSSGDDTPPVFVENPWGDHFRILRVSGERDPTDELPTTACEEFRGKSVRVVFSGRAIHYAEIAQRLRSHGAVHVERDFLSGLSPLAFLRSGNPQQQQQQQQQLLSNETLQKPPVLTLAQALPLFLEEHFHSKFPEEQPQLPQEEGGSSSDLQRFRRNKAVHDATLAVGRSLLNLCENNSSSSINSVDASDPLQMEMLQQKRDPRLKTERDWCGGIRSISISGFMSVRSDRPVTMEFPVASADLDDRQPSVWLITGPNGAGKSLLLEALSWCLFGRTLRSDMAADDVINDDSSECCVCVQFTDEEQLVVERRRRRTGGKDGRHTIHVSNPRLLKSHIAATNAAIAAHLGVEFDIFLFTAAVSLGTAAAAVAAPGSPSSSVGGGSSSSGSSQRQIAWDVYKNRVIERLLGLDALDQMKTVVDKDLSAAQARAQEMARLREERLARRQVALERMAALRRQADAMQQEISTQLEPALERWEREILRRRQQCEDQLQNQQQQQQQQQRRLDDGPSDDLLQSVVGQDNIAAQSPDRWKLDFERAAHRKLADVYKYSLRCLSSDPALDRWKTAVAVAHVQATAIQQHLLLEQSSSLSSSSSSSSSSAAAAGAAPVSDSSNSVDSPDAGISPPAAHATALALLEQAFAEAARTRESISVLAARRSWLEDQLAEEHRLLESEASEALLQDLARRLEVELVRTEALQFWAMSLAVPGKRVALNPKTATARVPSVRAFVLERTVGVMNELLAEFSERLFPSPSVAAAAAAVEVGRHSRSEREKAQFHLQLDGNLRPATPMGKRSAGQRRRMDLAVLFAVNEIARQVARFRPQFLFLDEVFDALDAEGQETVQGLLRWLCLRYGDIFVISHSARWITAERAPGAGLGRNQREIRVELRDGSSQYTTLP